MRIEQRIGRVDRIGQRHVVRALNFVLEGTVEHRVRQVLEEKLELIAQEFGVDKAADVMDSVEVEPIFDELFVHGLQDPVSIEKECEAVIDQVREKVAASRRGSSVLTEEHLMEGGEARKWRDHPAQYWLERALSTGLPTRGGAAEKAGDLWRVKWPDGTESRRACFDARTSEEHPEAEWITLEDPRARAVLSELPRCVAGQPVPAVRVTGLPETVCGVWSLWEISLLADGFSRKRFLPVFTSDEGRTFLPTARRIWDLLLTEDLACSSKFEIENSSEWFQRSLGAAEQEGERLFSELLEEHRAWILEERERLRYAFEARFRGVAKVGLPAVREYRRRRLEAEHQSRLAALESAEACAPDLSAVLILRISGPGEGTA